MAATATNLTIRRATVADVGQIAQLINDCAEYGLMLHRSLADLYDNVRDYLVVDDRGQVAGVCGLKVVWANLAEVYALAVSPEYRGRGLGKKLVHACVDEARQLHVRRLMTLTYERTFFEKCGFGVVDRQALPLKVWSECLRCPKNQACDEIAMIRVLEGMPEIEAPKPAQPAPGHYVVPITLDRKRVSASRSEAPSSSDPPQKP